MSPISLLGTDWEHLSVTCGSPDRFPYSNNASMCSHRTGDMGYSYNFSIGTYQCFCLPIHIPTQTLVCLINDFIDYSVSVRQYRRCRNLVDIGHHP